MNLLSGATHAHMRILCGQNPSVGYCSNSIPAKPLTLSCSNVAGFLLSMRSLKSSCPYLGYINIDVAAAWTSP